MSGNTGAEGIHATSQTGRDMATSLATTRFQGTSVVAVCYILLCRRGLHLRRFLLLVVAVALFTVSILASHSTRANKLSRLAVFFLYYWAAWSRPWFIRFFRLLYLLDQALTSVVKMYSSTLAVLPFLASMVASMPIRRQESSSASSNSSANASDILVLRE